MSNWQIPFDKVRQLGAGGFADVWLALDADGKQWAIKLLRESASADDVARFRKEVRILSALSHPGIVPIIRSRLDEEPYWFSMPVYPSSLSTELDRLRQDSVAARKVIRGLFDALEYAHSRGVLHRDLKPPNILLTANDEPVVADFGIGHRLNSDSTRLTLTGEGLGTVGYVAPEQWVDAKGVSYTADVYSLGRILYDFSLGGAAELAKPWVAQVVSGATGMLAADRFQSIREFNRAWDEGVGQRVKWELGRLAGERSKTQTNDRLPKLEQLCCKWAGEAGLARAFPQAGVRLFLDMIELGGDEAWKGLIDAALRLGCFGKLDDVSELTSWLRVLGPMRPTEYADPWKRVERINVGRILDLLEISTVLVARTSAAADSQQKSVARNIFRNALRRSPDAVSAWINRQRVSPHVGTAEFASRFETAVAWLEAGVGGQDGS